jgi:hypothetical protein
MVNFRFHIVSLIAVFLALGIGLVLGTTFLEDATVDTLEGQLQGLESDLDREAERNADLQRQLDAFEAEATGLDEQLGESLFDGRLRGVPVLVVASDGIDGGLVDRVTGALEQADAEWAGVWWMTDRLALDDDEEVADLADALGVDTDDPDRLRNNLALQVGDVLFGAADLPEAAAGDGGVDGAVEPTSAAQEPAEPGIVAALRESGFIDYDVPDDEEAVTLPASGLRIVVVSGPEASVAPDDALVPVLTDLAVDGPVPVVVAEPSVRPDNPGEGDDEPDERLVHTVREHDDLADRVSTVDDLDRVAGRVAMVLALADARAPEPTVGHYGMGNGADRLLPETEDTEDEG